MKNYPVESNIRIFLDINYFVPLLSCSHVHLLFIGISFMRLSGSRQAFLFHIVRITPINICLLIKTGKNVCHDAVKVLDTK